MEALNVLDGTDLPLIDLSLFPSENVDQNQLESHEFNELRQACQELGFFRVINHGVDPTLVQAVEGIIRDMLALPAEIKNRAIFPIFNTGYGPSQVDDVAKDSTPESMCLPWDHLLPNSVEKISAKLWPQGNPAFCQSASELFEKSYGNLRMNYYEKSTDKEMISKAHTDISCLTILYQDDVGGLQIRTKQGKWMDRKPLPGSFVINVGDILQMWSNGRYRSAQHCVVYGKSNRNRLSMAYFHDFLDEFEISCPKEMIDQEHPQLYKVVTKGDIVAYYKKVGPNLYTPLHFKL